MSTSAATDVPVATEVKVTREALVVGLSDGRVVSVKVWALRFVPTPDECKTCSCDGGTPRKLLGGATSGWRYEQWHCFKCRTYRIFSRLQVNTKKVRT